MSSQPTPSNETEQHAAHEGDRRHQQRVPLQLRANRARRWVAGAWRDLEALLTDISSRGIGLSLTDEVRLGDRVSLTVALQGDDADLRVTVEIRHVRPDAQTGRWRAGGLFRNLPPHDHERVMRFIESSSRL
jgi:c-di-GMP-binding flagellar brake protein YcgR